LNGKWSEEGRIWGGHHIYREKDGPLLARSGERGR